MAQLSGMFNYPMVHLSGVHCIYNVCMYNGYMQKKLVFNLEVF